MVETLMRYSVQLATSVDVAFLAAVIDEDREQWSGDGDAVPIDRLLRTCACSTQVWAARDSDGTPTALWGVTPVSDDPTSDICGCWPARPSTTTPTSSNRSSRLVFGEMLSQFPRLENFVDSRKVRAIELLRSIGFAIEPAIPRPADDADFHRVWIDSDRLQIGGRVSRLAQLTPSFHLRAARMSG